MVCKQFNELHSKDIGFKSLTENIDTATSGGKLVFHNFGALAEFEREVVKERTQAGLTAVRARGRLGGQPRIEITDPKKIQLARKLYQNMNMPVQEICAMLHLCRSTLYRYVGMEKAAGGLTVKE